MKWATRELTPEELKKQYVSVTQEQYASNSLSPGGRKGQRRWIR
jgi:hypothetical protein